MELTGKDLIVYILENDLEDNVFFKDGKFVGFMTLDEAAIKFNVGKDTVLTWYILGMIEGVNIGKDVYILPTAENPIETIL